MKRRLLSRLPAKILKREGISEERVSGRLPFRVVHAVEEADEGTLAPAQDPIQPAAQRFGHDFAGVTRTDSGDRVGVANARFEAVQHAVELDAVGMEIIPGQIGQLVSGTGKHPLICQVVNGEAGLGGGPPPCPFSFVFDQQRHQAGVPIVRMHQFRLPGQVAGELSDAFGEENESLGIVRIIGPLFLIQTGAAIKFRLTKEINCQVRLAFAFENFGLNPARSQRQIYPPAKRMKIGKLFRNPQVERRDQTDLQTGASQRLCQRAHHVGQPARFGIRMYLAAGKQDFHGMAKGRGRPVYAVIRSVFK